MTGPRADRPRTQPEYGIPGSIDGSLPWSWAQERLEAALLYWMATTADDGRPHVMPVWGAWVDEAFWTEGGERTRRARNLAARPSVVVSLQQGDDVVIVEGSAESRRAPEPDLARRLVDGFEKYRHSHGYAVDPGHWEAGGLWRVAPRKVLGWGRFPEDATRWWFEEG